MMSKRPILPVVSVEESAGDFRRLSCPRCKSSVFRVSRRFLDLLVSIFMPVRRYRCISMECPWEGNFREKRYSQAFHGRGELNERKCRFIEPSPMGRTTVPGKTSR
jgi:hypothetical protein